MCVSRAHMLGGHMYGTCSFSEQRSASEHWTRSTNNASGFTSATSRARTSLGSIHPREGFLSARPRSPGNLGSSVSLNRSRNNIHRPFVCLEMHIRISSVHVQSIHSQYEERALLKFARIKIQSRFRVDSYLQSYEIRVYS